jgi:hypothetical protein
MDRLRRTKTIGDLYASTCAEVRLNAYPGQVFKGTVTMGASLDPNLRTAKVRVEVVSGFMRLGCLPRPRSAAEHGSPHRGASQPSCTCTTATLSICWLRTENSAAWKSSVEIPSLKHAGRQVRIKPGERVVVNALVRSTVDQ